MGLETGIYINDLVVTNPPGTDGKNQGDDHIRLEKSTVKNSFAGFLGAVLVTGVDGGVADVYTLTPATALPSYTSKTLIEFTPVANNLTSTPTLNISGLGAKTIKSVSGATLLPNELVAGTPVLASYDGTSMLLIGPTKKYIDQSIVNGIIPAQSLGFYRSNGVVSDYTQTHTGYAQKEVKGADIASAATIDLTAATGNLAHVTGTTTITAITVASGAEYTLVFDGALKLTNGTNLILLTGADITTAAGDSIKVRGDGTAARAVSYNRKSGRSLVGIPRITVITATGTWTCPDDVTLIEVSMVDGGDGGHNSSGGTGFGFKGADSGAGGVSVLTVTPGTVYTATVGAGGAIGTGADTTGGSSSFAGSGLTTMTTANASFKNPKGTGGNPSAAAGASGINGIGGTSMLGQPGRTTATSGYGAGGMGGFDNSSGATAGADGVIIIRY